MPSTDTIAAISSAVGPAARMIVRVTGPDAQVVAGRLCELLPAPGGAVRTSIHIADLAVPAWVYLFAEGRSYTSQPLVEFHLPGNPLLARMLLDAIISEGGVRHAEPGEFTARAYFSGRINLAEAEGVAATIAAHGEAELRAARQLLAGELARRLRPATDLLADTLALVEAEIDFSDQEDVTFLTRDEVLRRIGEVDALLDELVRTSSRFESLAHEPTFVLVGRPNAGKSTLLNALAGHERTVVSPVAGTTRDALSAEVRLNRGMVRVIDVAGLDAHAESEGTPPEVARQMADRAARTIESADRVVLVRDVTDARPPLRLERPPDLVVFTKLDQVARDTGVSPVRAHVEGERLIVRVSAVTAEGFDRLRTDLDRLAFGSTESSGGTLALNARHLDAIAEARDALAGAGETAQEAGQELVAVELRDALDALGRVLGQVTPDDVLGRIFASFCIGK